MTREADMALLAAGSYWDVRSPDGATPITESNEGIGRIGVRLQFPTMQTTGSTPAVPFAVLEGVTGTVTTADIVKGKNGR